MHKYSTNRAKVILLDTAGVLLVVISPITGLVPGPGGIPVFLAGLGLLAVNHEWARRLLVFIKDKGGELANRIFVEHPVVKWAYDIVATLLVILGIWLIFRFTSNALQVVAVASSLAGLALFLGNRKRLKKFSRWLRNHPLHQK